MSGHSAGPDRSLYRSLAGQIDTLADRFERVWLSGERPRIEDYLSQASSDRGPEAARQLLLELVMIDLEHRWRGAGSSANQEVATVEASTSDTVPVRPLLEHYAERFPELRRADGLPDEAIAFEYRVRHLWGDRPAPSEYLQRFPAKQPGLRKALERIHAELAAEARQRKPARPEPAEKSKPRRPLALRRFVDNLTASGLMTAEEIVAFQQGLAPEKQPRDGAALARRLVKDKKLTRYQAEQVYRGRVQALSFGEYVVLEPLGAGGMGEVLKAEHRTMGRVVALKTISPKLLGSDEAVKRFRREVRAAAKLIHPNIVTAFDASEYKGVHYLAMEYVDGQDLAGLLKHAGPLPVEEAVDYVLQAARGLEYAHQNGVVHRDIKPANLLLDRQGTVKILDMGLARLDEGPHEGDEPDSDRLTASSQMMGTCDYMAPEQAMDTHGVDHRADIYSLGCTLYRLLTGKRPYGGTTPIQVLYAHREGPIPSLREARPDVPEPLDAVFRKMVAKRPEDRQASMTEVIAEMEACIAPPEDRPAPPPVDRVLAAFLADMARGQTGPDLSRMVESDTALKAETTLPRPRRRGKLLTRRQQRLVLAVGGSILGVVLFAALLVALLSGPSEEPSAQSEGSAKPGERAPTKPEPSSHADRPASRQLGYSIYHRATESVTEIEDYTNLVVDFRWQNYGDELIKAARRAGIPVELAMDARGDLAELADQVIPLASKNRDVVRAVCLHDPFVFGKKPADLAAFGRILKRSVPEIEFWVAVVDQPKKGTEAYSVPDEVDLLQVVFCGCPTPAAVAARGDEVVPHWLSKAKGRPVLAFWCCWTPGAPGLIPKCEPGTLSACRKVVEKYNLGGLLVDNYGPDPAPEERGHVGIATRPELVEEVRRIASQWRIERETAQDWGPGEREPRIGLSPREATEGFVSLFNGKTLDGWQGATDAYVVEQGKLVSAKGGKGPLYTIKQYGDFILRFEFKLEPGANNGVLLRAPLGGKPATDCMEIQILDDSSFVHADLNPAQYAQYNGSIWGVAPAQRGYLRPCGLWNSEEILCRGRRVQVTLNSTTILDVGLDGFGSDVLEKVHGLKRDAGYLGFLAQGSRVEFRNIRIKELQGQASAAPVPRQSTRWLGYGVGSSAEVEQVAAYTNVVWKYGGGDPNGIVAAARAAGLKVVLVFECNSGSEAVKEEVISAARRDRDVVAAVCWEIPYMKGHQPVDLTQFGRTLKESAPGVQLWCNLAYQGQARRLPLPPEVDVLMVEIGPVTTPEAVKQKAEEVLPERIDKAAGRPIFLIWWQGHRQKPQGLVPECQPGMVRTLGQVVESYDLKGLFLISYGTGFQDAVGIGTSPMMVSEVRDIARGWGVQGLPDRSQTAPPPAVAPFDESRAKEHQQAWADYLGVPVERAVDLGGGVKMTMVLIPPGEFDMGATPEEIDRFTAEAEQQKVHKWALTGVATNHPQHHVKITKPVYFGAHEVTVEQFAQFAEASQYRTEAEKDGQGGLVFNAEIRDWKRTAGLTWRNPGIPQHGSHPVVMVSWNDAQAFCNWLGARERKTCRLPTEAESEYACRAGTTSFWYVGNEERELRRVANIADSSFKRQFPAATANVPWDDGYPFTAPVGRFEPNAFGLYDMHGNVWEWCHDWYDAKYYERSPVEDPKGPSSGKWRLVPDFVRLSFRRPRGHGPAHDANAAHWLSRRLRNR